MSLGAVAPSQAAVVFCGSSIPPDVRPPSRSHAMRKEGFCWAKFEAIRNEKTAEALRAFCVWNDSGGDHDGSRNDCRHLPDRSRRSSVCRLLAKLLVRVPDDHATRCHPCSAHYSTRRLFVDRRVTGQKGLSSSAV
jgi:hypothetical protein